MEDLANELAVLKAAYGNCVNDLGVLKAAYGNCVNDLARTRGHLQQAEETLFQLSELLRTRAADIQTARIDDPGATGSGR